MLRRRFIQTLMSGLGGLALPTTLPAQLKHSEKPAILVQRSALAGWQYHRGEAVWPQLRLGQGLSLRHEAGNRYDRNAVAIYWRDEMLGYLPRRENYAVAQMLERGEVLAGRIESLAESSNPWARLSLSVHLHPRGAA